MSWVRIDDGFATNPKIAALTDRELRVWIRVLCYCGSQQDPSIDRVAKREIIGLSTRLILKLNNIELLDESGDDYEIHDWAKYQPKDLTGAQRQANWRARRNAGRNGGRNGLRNANVDGSDRYENVTSRADAQARPVPYPSSKDETSAVDVAAENTEQHDDYVEPKDLDPKVAGLIAQVVDHNEDIPF